MQISVPDNYDVLWIRLLNDVASDFRLYGLNNPKTTPDYYELYGEIYSAGKRALNNISPDGAASGIYNTTIYTTNY